MNRSTNVGMQELLSRVHARRSPTCWLLLFLLRVDVGAVFTTMLWSSLCFLDLLYTKAGSSSTSDRAPLSPPNSWVTYLQMCYLPNTQSTNSSRHHLHFSTFVLPRRIPSCKITWAYLQSSLSVFCSHPILLTNLPFLTHSSQHPSLSVDTF